MIAKLYLGVLWLYGVVWGLTLVILIWAMAVEGPRLLDCLSEFVGE